jgi:hypothetical protein
VIAENLTLEEEILWYIKCVLKSHIEYESIDQVEKHINNMIHKLDQYLKILGKIMVSNLLI